MIGGWILDGWMQIRNGTGSQSGAGSASAKKGAFHRVGIAAVGRSIIVPQSARFRMAVVGRHVQCGLGQPRRRRRQRRKRRQRRNCGSGDRMQRFSAVDLRLHCRPLPLDGIDRKDRRKLFAVETAGSVRKPETPFQSICINPFII